MPRRINIDGPLRNATVRLRQDQADWLASLPGGSSEGLRALIDRNRRPGVQLTDYEALRVLRAAIVGGETEVALRLVDVLLQRLEGEREVSEGEQQAGEGHG